MNSNIGKLAILTEPDTQGVIINFNVDGHKAYTVVLNDSRSVRQIMPIDVAAIVECKLAVCDCEGPHYRDDMRNCRGLNGKLHLPRYSRWPYLRS